MVQLSVHEAAYVKKTVEDMEEEWKRYDDEGKQKEWFHEQMHWFVEYLFQDSGRCRKDEEAYVACLKKYRMSDYQDEELLQTIMEKGRIDVSAIYLVWYARNIVQRKMVIRADNPVGNAFLKELFLGEWTKKKTDSEHLKLRITNYQLVMEWAKIHYRSNLGKVAALSDEELEVLKLGDKKLFLCCMKNGFIRPGRVDKYIEYAFREGKFKLAIELIRLKNEDA